MKVQGGALAAALEREHREIGEGIDGYTSQQPGEQERVAALRRAVEALRRHIYLEEEFLFPPMDEELAIPTMVMLREHGEIWRRLDQIEQELDRGGDSVPQACRELLVVLASHNAKEEPIFYGRADATLDESESAQLSELIESGRMPEGWVCEQG